MKKRILLLLVAMIGMATSAGWAKDTNVLTIEGSTCYANGYPITIKAGTEGNVAISVNGTDETATLVSTGTIYGGSKDKAVDNTTITMESGIIKNIFGGGFFQNATNTNITVTGGEITNLLVGGGHGPKASLDASSNKTADVTGKTTISVDNATVYYLISGGYEYAKTKTVETTVAGADTKITYILGGGYAPVSIGQGLDTDYETIANGVQTSNFTMINGEITGILFVGGGYSYSYSKEVTATLTGVKIGAGLLGTGSNGRSDNVTVKATDCIFEKSGADPIEIAAVNRGKVGSVSMTFDNCIFPDLVEDYFCYLGATHGWQSGSFPVPTSDQITFTFTGSTVRPLVKISQGIQDLILTGVAATVDVVAQDKSTNINTFTIPAGKTWTFNSALKIGSDVTLTNNGTLVVKNFFTISKVDQLAMALSSVTKGGSIYLSDVTAENMLAELNKGEKKELTAGICILCSDATVYTDIASARQSTATGTVKYIKLESETYSLEIPAALTVVPTIKTKPTASTIEAGQPLSASILTGGEAKATVKEAEGDKEVVVSGVFSWMNPSTQATVGTKSYKAVFTPTDLTKYEVVKDIDVEIKDVKQYYTVTIGKCENGKIEVTDGNSAGKYEDKKVLAVKAIPNDHYDFSAWGTGITVNNGSYTVSANAVLTATFVAKNYAVTIGDNVKVTKQDGTSVNTGNLPYGTVLNVVAAPTGNVGSLKSLTCNDKEVINNTVTVDGALNIQAAFNAFVPSTYRISLGDNVKNGKIQLFDENGNAIAFGSALTENTVVSVVVVPDPGYELDGSVTVADATYINGKFTVGQKAVTVSATFKPKKFKVEIAAENATITLSQTDNLNEVAYGTSIQITEAKAAKDYKLLAVVVNGKEIAKGESFIVKGETKVNAVVQKLPEVVFADKEQTYTYNKAAQAFVVRTVPAGISGITITYQKEGSKAKDADNATAPTEAGTYEVFATLDANSSYASMDAKSIGTLTIEKAPYPAAIIPTAENVNTGDAENEYHWKSADDTDSNFRTAYYKLPANSNYREPEFVIPATTELENSLPKVTLGEGWIKTRSTTISLSLNAANGSVSVWNGDVQVTSETTLYAGQTLTLKAIPADASYSTRPEWSNNVTVKDGVASITLPEDAATVTATFIGKEKAPLTNKDYTSLYTGTAFGDKGAPEIESSVSGWLVTFKQNGVTFDEPTAVGDYQMIANRPTDDVYQAATDVIVGTLKITKADAEISDIVGTDITTIQTLNQSVISGTANVEGTFSWVNPNTQLTAGTYDDITVLFTPADDNYAPVSGKAKVIVNALADAVVVRTIELTESDPANGNGVVLTLNGTTVTAGTAVKAGDKLTATFSAKSGYTATAKINDTDYASGTEYVVKDEGNMSIVVTYTKNQTIDPNPGTDPDPDPVVDVTGVSLDKSELTLAVKGTYTLKATVAPADADNKNVTWKSSDDKIATVDKDGKVTAVAIGKATITVTTEDGGKTATCVVTVDAATGLEELIANTRVYGQDHAIRIEPAMSVNVLVVSMNGQLIYNDIVSSATQIPVPAAGIYIVKLGTGNDTSVRKVSVK